MSAFDVILNIIPAPAGLTAVFKPTTEGYDQEHREPVAAIALLYDQKELAPVGQASFRHVVAMVIDRDLGTLSPVDESNDFDRLEWQQATCQCSKN